MTKQTREELEKKARKFYDKYTTTLSILIIATMFFGLWYFFIIKDYKDIQKENTALKEQISYNETSQTYILKWECWTKLFGVLTGTETFHSKELYNKGYKHFSEGNCEVLP